MRLWPRFRRLRRLRRFVRRNRWWLLVGLVALWWAQQRGLLPAIPTLPSWSLPWPPAAERAPSGGHYDRDDWPHWSDEDHDCRNTRHEVLAAESEVPVTYADRERCKVARGRWRCPFTGRVITDPGKLDIDHLVPLHEAHKSGGHAWTTERRRRYANDLTEPAHLVAVDRHANRAKGDKGPERWLPSDPSARCRYVTQWRAVKSRWGLTMSPAQRAAMQGYEATCARGRVPARPH